MQLKNHAIGQLFTSFGECYKQKTYIFFVGMYVYNFIKIISCIRY